VAAVMQITDGTTTINLIGSDGYQLIYNGWSPNLAHLSNSSMGPVFENVVESIPIAITGDSMVQIMERYAALSDLLHQSEVWSKNDAGVDAVKFKYQPNGSALASPLQAVIVGRSNSGRFLAPPSTYNDAAFVGNVMAPVVVSFTRRGLLLGATEAKSSATSTSNPAILTATTFTDEPKIPVPYDAKIEFYDTGALSAIDPIQNMAIFFSNSANKFHIEEGEDASADTGMTDTAVATASGGNVIRGTLAPASQNTATYAQANWSTFDSGIRMVTVAAMIRSQDAIAFSTYLRLGTNITTGEIINSNVSYVDGTNTNPLIVYYGPIALSQGMSNYDIRFVFNGITGSGDFDLDYFCIIGLDENTRQFYFEKNSYHAREQLFINHNLDSKLKPSVYMADDGPVSITYSGYEAGDALLVASGNSISALVMGGGGNSANYIINDSGTDPLDIDLTVTRTMGYLTPL